MLNTYFNKQSIGHFIKPELDSEDKNMRSSDKGHQTKLEVEEIRLWFPGILGFLPSTKKFVQEKAKINQENTGVKQ